MMNTVSGQSKIEAGVFQFDVLLGDVDANVETAIAGIDRLCATGVRLVVLPELWSCGFDGPGMAAHADRTPEILDRLSEMARRSGTVITGSLPEKAGSAIYNTLYVVDADGRMAGHYRKIHLFSLMDEGQSFSPGECAATCDTACGRLGLMVCYDLRFPELCRVLAVNDAEIVVVPAQWPSARITHWETLLSARAIENQVFVIGTNRCGEDPDLSFSGHSRIISPFGEILADAGEKEGAASAVIDLAEIDACRSRFSTIAERIPDAYRC